jgi:gluconokinase
MGVSGSGKSTVGRALAAKQAWAFYDGDDYHPARNIEKMHRGEPLDDKDRAPWLDRLRGLITRKLAAGESSILACSALAERYRRRLLPADPLLADRVVFVYLRITPEAARNRVLSRTRHFMRADLVESQFSILDEPHNAIRMDAEEPVERIVERIAEALDHVPRDTF